ncbi:hypothetical protein [Streptomyces sp. NPDC101455]|uniref:hypothetical protein n=1 Tax=Streptomyces sp. NPDC101455 TaxID=3366142 RepID=UPI0038202120
MTEVAVTLASIAAVLEIWGIVWTIKDIRTERLRLASYLELPRNVYGSAHARFGALMGTAAGTVSNQTLEQRIEALEATQRGLRDELDRRDQETVERLTTDFQSALTASEQTINDQFAKLRTYVVGGQTSWMRAYRGPIVLTAGVLAGLLANIFSNL